MGDSKTPFGDALKKIDTLPASELDLEVSATEAEGAKVEVDVSKPIGKGWSFGAIARWSSKGDAGVAAKLKKTWGGKG